MRDVHSVVEQRYTTPLGQLAARQWGQAGDLPVLALHGWQDNAASHDRLIPLLLEGLGGNRQVVAVDLLGHGFSDHKRDATAYTLADYLGGLAGLPAKLGWQHYILLGHSLGAALCACLAAMWPMRTAALVKIDSVGPLTGSPAATCAQLRRSLLMQKHTLSARQYPDLEAMAQRRAQAGDLSITAARALVARNHRKMGVGYCWRNDPKLRWLTPVYLSEAQTQALLGAVQAPTLIIRAEGGLLTNMDLVTARCRSMAKARLITLPGHHHLHMDNPQPVASSIIEFIKNAVETPG